ncbi:hypothetical protein COOONC_26414 [Cooperia oncophora]
MNQSRVLRPRIAGCDQINGLWKRANGTKPTPRNSSSKKTSGGCCEENDEAKNGKSHGTRCGRPNGRSYEEYQPKWFSTKKKLQDENHRHTYS